MGIYDSLQFYNQPEIIKSRKSSFITILNFIAIIRDFGLILTRGKQIGRQSLNISFEVKQWQQ